MIRELDYYTYGAEQYILIFKRSEPERSHIYLITLGSKRQLRISEVLTRMEKEGREIFIREDSNDKVIGVVVR